MPLNCCRECWTLWEVPGAHSIEDNKESIAVQFINIIYLMKGALRQAEATLNSETSFWCRGEFYRRQTRCKLLWQSVALFSISLLDLLPFFLLYLVLMISNERGKIGHQILLIHRTHSALVI